MDDDLAKQVEKFKEAIIEFGEILPEVLMPQIKAAIEVARGIYSRPGKPTVTSACPTGIMTMVSCAGSRKLAKPTSWNSRPNKLETIIASWPISGVNLPKPGSWRRHNERDKI